MKAVIKNDRQFDVIMSDIYNQYREYGELAVDYGKPFKDTTKAQMGFFFGALIDSVLKFYKDKGEIWDINEAKENFYQACAYMDERLKKRVTRFNGEQYEVPKRLSEMDRETASIFIDKCIYLIDHAKCFDGLYLHSSIRNTWILHINQDELRAVQNITLPRLDKEYLAYQHKEPCLWCGCTQNIQVHHLKEMGFTGVGYKADDWCSVPLCQSCHLAYHTQGKESFEKDMRWITKYVSLVDFCRMRYLKWRNKR